MRTGDAHPDRITLYHTAVHMDFVIRSSPAEIALLDQNILSRPYKLQTLCLRNPIDQLQAPLVPLFNDFLRQTIELRGGCSFTCGVFENKSPVELEFFDHG